MARDSRVPCVLRDLPLLAALLALVAPRPVLAGPASEAYDRRARVESEYYRELKKLGRDATPKQRSALRTRMLSPTAAESTNAVLDQAAAQEQIVRQHAYEGLKKKVGAGLVPRWILGPGESGPSAPAPEKGTAEAAPQAGASQVTVPEQPATPQEAIVVGDGLGVAKEIEFMPRPKPSPSPSLAPTGAKARGKGK